MTITRTDATVQQAAPETANNPAPTDTAEQIKLFVSVVYQPSDLVEVRLIRRRTEKKPSHWVAARELASTKLIERLRVKNAEGYSVYVGLHPRSRKGDGITLAKDCTDAKPCGRCYKCTVPDRRVLFVDMDDIDIGSAMHRLGAADVAGPSLISNSGHGCHALWTLEEPIGQEQYRAVQKAMAALFDGDPGMHDAPRVLRLPGFLNCKEDRPVVPCVVMRSNAQLYYAVTEFPSGPVQLKRARTSRTGSAKFEHPARHEAVKRFGVAVWKDGASFAALDKQLHEYNDTECRPPKSDKEIDDLCGWIKHNVEQPPPAEAEDIPEHPNFTDVGNAQRLTRRYGHRLRYCHSTERWYCWSGVLWRGDDNRTAVRLARETMRDVAIVGVKNGNKEQVKHAMRSESAARIHAMMEQARSMHPISCTADALDPDDHLLNTLTGILDTTTGELLEHDPKYMITKLAPVQYDPDAVCPLFDKFLAETTCNDGELEDYILETLGMCLTGDIKEQCLPVWWGSGSNGKSVLIDSVVGLLGDYACEAPSDLLVLKHSDRHPTEIAGLMGKRLVVASETDKGAKLRVQLVKMLTGDLHITARFMRTDFFTYRRTFKTIMRTNNKPKIGENTHAIWRRLKLVPFKNEVPDQDQDRELVTKLADEWPGILALLLNGCIRWRNRGRLHTPKAVTDATSTYKAENDAVGQFVEECLVFDKEGWAATAALDAAVTSWSMQNDMALKWGEVRSHIKDRGCTSKPRHAGRGWAGLRLVETDV